ncbi:proteinase-activated receptor 1-like [Denticeps clupeoides]|uniref:proteinase-activated receptor 1-like n=1 Tax=Denticeps clupeoides TaxID=299321 RepID=UPI0010A47581|nr:proteinase-activated receptor 1-like [Denticeps clupeoides]
MSMLMTQILPALYMVLCVLALPLNAACLITFVWRIPEKKPAVIYMMSLAGVNLLFSLFVPLKIFCHFSVRSGIWTFTSAACRSSTALFYFSMSCVTSLIMSISLDRMLAVAYAMPSRTYRTSRNAVLLCVLVGFLALGSSLPFFLSTRVQQNQTLLNCSQLWDNEDDLYLHQFPYVFCVFFLLPTLVTSVCYSLFMWALWKIPLGTSSLVSRTKRRSLVLLFLIVTILLLFFLPLNVVLLLRGHHRRSEEEKLYRAYLLSLCAAGSSVSLGPLVYYFGSKQVQHELDSVWRHVSRWRK